MTSARLSFAVAATLSAAPILAQTVRVPARTLPPSSQLRPFVWPDMPESMEAYRLVAAFFDRHLGTQGALR